MPQVVPSPVRRARPRALGGAVGLALLLAAPVPARAADPAAHPDPGVTADGTAPPVAVRLVAGSRGPAQRGRRVTHVDVLAADGTRRRVRSVGPGALEASPALDPAGRRVAFALQDGRIAVVDLADGALRVLRPPGLPREPAGSGDLSRWTVVAGADLAWTTDGRRVLARGITSRLREGRWASALAEYRSVACVVASRRCTTAGAGAASDLLPLPGGRLLRLDGPNGTGRGSERATYGLQSLRQQRSILRTRDRPVRTSAALDPGAAGGRTARVLRTVLGSGATGVVGLGGRAAGPAGAIVLRTSTRFSPQRSDPGFPPDGDPGVQVVSRVLRPWVVSPAGRLRTMPLPLAVPPIGSLRDGRWILPSAEARDRPGAGAPEPGLATLDARGRVSDVRAGGRPLTPVGIALDAGLPDTFAVGAEFVAAWPAGDDLLVELRDGGGPGVLVFPGDGALVRVPLDGAAVRLVDRTEGATYDVR